jgi:hypothetical protein
MMTFGRWQCGEGTSIDEDEKPQESTGRKRVDSSVETAVAWLRLLWLAVAMVVHDVLCWFREEEELPLSRAATTTTIMLSTA